MPTVPMTPSQRGGPSGLPRFQRLGLFMARRRWWVIGAWAVVLLAALPFAPRAGSVLRAGGFTLPDLPSEEARATLAQLGVPPSVLAIVIESTGSARAGEPAFEAAAAAAVADVPRAAHVTGIQSHLLQPRQVSADGTVVYDIVDLDLSPDDSPAAMAPVQAALHDEPGIRTLIGGAPAFYGDIQTASEEDLRRAELVSLPLAAIALVLIFGGIVAAGVPLVVGGSAVLLALAAIFLLASVTPMSIFVLNLATLLGLGLGVDYSLLLTSRFREELGRRGGGRRADGSIDRAAVDEAVGVTVATAGRAIFFSGFTVLLGLIGLVLFDFMILRSVGVAGAIVVGMAVLAALTLLPAVLAVLGPRLGALSVRSLLRRPPPDPERAAARESLGAAGALGDAAPVARLRAHPRHPHPAGRAVPARPVRCAGRDDPAGRPGVQAGVRRPVDDLRGGDVRAARAGHPGHGPDHRPGDPGQALRLFAGARIRPAGGARGRPGGPRPAPDASPVPAALRDAGRAARPVRRCGPGRYDQR